MAEWLAVHEPYKLSRVMSLVREVHGGRVYNANFGVRQKGSGQYAKMIADRFHNAVRRFQLNVDRATLDCTLFNVPGNQGELF